MWFISPPVPQHKEWGVSLTLATALSQPTTAAQVRHLGMRSTLCLWEMSRQKLLKPCLSSADYPVHTLKFCTLLKVSPEKPALHICSYWGVLELSTDGWGRVKSQVGHSKQKKVGHSLQQKSQVPEVPSRDTGRLWGPPRLRAVPC